MAQKYKNIPVKPEVYAKVAMAAEANGFGERGLGAQVEQWAARELPVCEHPKQAVSVEIFPSQSILGGTQLERKGWYCSICNRVYQYSAVENPEGTTHKKQVKQQEAVSA